MAGLILPNRGIVKPPPGATIQGGHPLAHGLKTFWLLNEGGGTQVCDAAGPWPVGTITNATWVAGEYGNALNFDGSGDYVNLTDYDVSGPHSWIACVTLDSSAVANYVKGIVGKFKEGSDLSGDTGLHLFSGTGNDSATPIGCVVHSSAGRTNVNSGGADAPLNRPVHIAGVWNGATLFYYQDGVFVASAGNTGTLGNNASPVCLGQYGIVTANTSLDGRIHYAAHYARALTPAEVQQLRYEPFGMFYAPRRYWVQVAGAPPPSGLVSRKALLGVGI